MSLNSSDARPVATFFGCFFFTNCETLSHFPKISFISLVEITSSFPLARKTREQRKIGSCAADRDVDAVARISNVSRISKQKIARSTVRITKISYIKALVSRGTTVVRNSENFVSNAFRLKCD